MIAEHAICGEQVFGLSSALASAMRKVVDALPEGNRASASDAAQRFLIEPEIDLLSRRRETERIPEPVMAEVRRAVLAGRKLRIHYAAVNRKPKWRTVDPLGLVTVRGKSYLLATVDGADRTYRLSRIWEVEELPEPAKRPERIDLDQMWQERSARFRASEDQLAVRLRLNPTRRAEVAATALAILTEALDADGWLLIEATFQDLRHATWALWQLDTDAEAVAPEILRTALYERAAKIAGRYQGPP